jgi:hypothetical protein
MGLYPKLLFRRSAVLILNDSNTTIALKSALEKLGAREFEMVALSLDPHRGLAALTVAQQRGVEHPISYAIKLFDSPDWQPEYAKKPLATNVAVEVTCSNCGGDRFALVTAGLGLYEETYAPCRECNAAANTKRWVRNERRETLPR